MESHDNILLISFNYYNEHLYIKLYVSDKANYLILRVIYLYYWRSITQPDRTKPKIAIPLITSVTLSDTWKMNGPFGIKTYWN
jgi:hypothetical protein